MAFKDFLSVVMDSANDWAQKQHDEYDKYTQMYSRMGREGLKREWENNKSRISCNTMRKRAFVEACEAND